MSELTYWVNERSAARNAMAQAVTGASVHRHSVRVMLAERWIAALFSQVAA